MPVKRITRWGDVRLSPQQRMAARGMVTDSPTDAWRLHPELFPSAEAAKKALQRGISGTFPYDSLFIGERPRNRITEGKYRPHGRGQQLRRMWVSNWRLPTLREEMEEVLGPLAMFDVGSATATEALPLSEPAAIAALPDADKLMMRARLQVGHNPLLLGAAAPEVQHGYGDGLDPAQLCRGDLVQPVHLGRWTIRWPNLAPVEVVDWLEPRHHRHQRAGSAANESERFS
jgi:hypothetical protein